MENGKLRIGLIGTGEMGSGIGGHLVRGGAEVLTSLRGRSPASAERVYGAGITVVDDLEDVARACSIVLSILPPDRAAGVARDFADAYRRGGVPRLLYADCNAIAPATAHRVGEIVTAAGMRYVDASIIGMAPRPGRSGPHVYACGPDVDEFAGLAAYGLEVRPLDGPLGAASTLKMCYAGITKAWTGIGAAMFERAYSTGVGEALTKEFGEHQQALNGWLTRQMEHMPPKAYRWIGEMREIEAFCASDPSQAEVYAGLAGIYVKIAESMAAKGPV
jgi:3-hydroxyisobutyrate dehydrogenase-like beta-hydroxyacid dehydrogenase